MKNRKAKILQTTTETSDKSSPVPVVSEINYIPPEVWTQVLGNLPAKSLMRFRCVSKSWCSIIDHPDFVPMHLKHNSVNCDKYKKFLVLKMLESTRVFSFSLTIRHANTLRIISHIFRESEGNGRFYISGRCNGLLLVTIYLSHERRFRLWNPCIRKSLIVPTPPLPANLIAKAEYIFGFAPDSKEYKVVAIILEECRIEKTAKLHVAVYTLSDQQWTVRNDGLNVDLLYVECLLGYSNLKINAIYFRGKAYWLGSDHYNNLQSRSSTYLVSFNFDTEKFTFAKLPFASYERDSLRVLFLLGESLAIFSISALSSSVRVLEKGEWIMWFSGISSKDGYELFFTHSLIGFSDNNLFYCESDGGRGCLIYGKNSYSIATSQVHKLTESKSVYFKLETYLESLVLHKGYGAQDLMSFQ